VTALLALLLLHENAVSTSRAEIGRSELRVTFEFTLEELAGLARLDLNHNGRIERAEWESTFPKLTGYVADRVQVDNNGERCRAEVEQGELPRDMDVSALLERISIAVRYRATSPLDHLQIRCGLFREHDGNPRHVMDLGDGRSLVFDRDRVEAEFPVTMKPIPWIPIAAGVVLSITVLLAAWFKPAQGAGFWIV